MCVCGTEEKIILCFGTKLTFQRNASKEVGRTKKEKGEEGIRADEDVLSPFQCIIVCFFFFEGNSEQLREAS